MGCMGMEGGKGACVYVHTSRGNTAGQSQICFLRACTSTLLLTYNNQTLTIILFGRALATQYVFWVGFQQLPPFHFLLLLPHNIQ